MLQDLGKTRMILWADDPELILTGSTRPFFAGFSQNIRVQRFDYEAEVGGSLLEGHAYFGSERAVKASLPPDKPASYSDLVRYLLLHNYGGLWCAHSYPVACMRAKPSRTLFLAATRAVASILLRSCLHASPRPCCMASMLCACGALIAS